MIVAADICEEVAGVDAQPARTAAKAGI